MKRAALTIPLLLTIAGCHARHVAKEEATMASPPKQQEVSSERPVRTTPGGMLDPKSMRQIQEALRQHGEEVEVTGRLDEQTEKGLMRFQRKEGQAATGLPDYDTLRRLDLDPKAIYLGGKERREATRDANGSK